MRHTHTHTNNIQGHSFQLKHPSIVCTRFLPFRLLFLFHRPTAPSSSSYSRSLPSSQPNIFVSSLLFFLRFFLSFGWKRVSPYTIPLFISATLVSRTRQFFVLLILSRPRYRIHPRKRSFSTSHRSTPGFGLAQI